MPRSTGSPAQSTPACAETHACAGEESALVRRLFTVNNMMMRLGDRLTAPIGLTSSRWLLLCALGRVEEPPTVRQLSEDALLSAQNVSRMLAAMEDEGLVERRTQPGSGRSLFVHLTDQGRTALEQTRELAKVFEQFFLDGINPEEVERTECTLQSLIDNLERFETKLEQSEESRREAAR